MAAELKDAVAEEVASIAVCYGRNATNNKQIEAMTVAFEENFTEGQVAEFKENASTRKKFSETLM